MVLTQRSFADLITFTRAGTATRVNSIGNIETVAADTPRFGHDPVTGEALGLLIEESRENLFLQSEDFTTTWAASVSGTSTRVNTASVFGGVGGGTITATSANGGLRQSVSGLAAAQHTMSFFLASTSDDVTVVLENGAASYGTGCSVALTPASGTVEALTGFTDGYSAAVSGGYIFTLVLPTAGGTNIANVEWRLANGDQMVIAIPQFEEGAFPTSYIPTTTATVTRNADDCSITGTDFSEWFNSNEGTIYVEAQTLYTTATGIPYVLTINDGTANETIEYRISSGSGFVVRDGAAVQAALGFSGVDLSQSFKIAGAFAANDFAHSTNGGAVATDGSGTLPTVTRMQIGANLVGSAHLNGHIKDIRFYPSRLPDAELQLLTA